MADEAYALGGAAPADTYLDIGRLLKAAADAGAVHPGYGFLSESAEFAWAVIDQGLLWIGPPPSAIEMLGDKVRARHIAREQGAPLAPGTAAPVPGAAEATAFGREHGPPVAIKAAYGGGGRGLKVARSLDEIPARFESAVREAEAAFGRGECFVERYLDRPRHVETQCLADRHGNVTRETALQRARRALAEFEIAGVATVLPFHRAIVTDPAPTARRSVTAEVDGKRVEVVLHTSADPAPARPRPRRAEPRQTNGDALLYPLQSTVVKVLAEEGATVAAGDTIVVVEAMKMEQPLTAHKPGTISALNAHPGRPVTPGTQICLIQ
ncbi:hypothetical protein D0T12_32095 [Actinomadura spongiicola]|uniref:Acetyl-/propionyl-CoA carboxylase subunit alpha n=1 Tax=Actinomadura spongiicola TaxID=2303421 RepID=A0A372G7B7_9ACTN|nr:hypothetical protein D0T12_32095 [Actinomadura spongiicola]